VDSYLSFRRTLEINEADLEAPKKLVLELSELTSICTPQVSYELEEMKFASISIDLKELAAIEKEWKSHRKKFDFFRDYSPFNFHGTPSKQNVKSILREGWKVGNGNALGSGIYFGFIPGTKKGDKNKVPVPGLDYKSKTAADGYASYSGALIIAEVDWGNFANWEDSTVSQDFSNWCAGNKTRFSGGDALTEWGLTNGYGSVKCPSSGYGVMLQHRYEITKKFWKTDKIRVCYVYSVGDKKVENII
jgi:hypothetical protein